MSEVMAGFLVGYALALATTPLLALGLVRMRVRSAVLARAVPEQMSVVPLAVVLHGFAFIVWTGVGIVLGLVLSGLEDRSPQGGLGSPNLAFTIIVLAGVLALIIPPLFLWRSARRRITVAALVLMGAFGWLMPHLAQWSRFGEG